MDDTNLKGQTYWVSCKSGRWFKLLTWHRNRPELHDPMTPLGLYRTSIETNHLSARAMCLVVGPCLGETSGVCQRDQNRGQTFLSAFENTVAVGWELWNDRCSVLLCADCTMTGRRPKVDNIVKIRYRCKCQWETHVIFDTCGYVWSQATCRSDGNNVSSAPMTYKGLLESGAGRTIFSHQYPIHRSNCQFRSSEVLKLELKSARVHRQHLGLDGSLTRGTPVHLCG